MEHSHGASDAPLLRCDGSVYDMYGGGTWKGHVWPGIVFVFWGLWWAMCAFRCHVREGSQFRSRAWWPGLCAIEPLLKIFGPPIGVLVELRLDHSEFLCVLLRSFDGWMVSLVMVNLWLLSSSKCYIFKGNTQALNYVYRNTDVKPAPGFICLEVHGTPFKVCRYCLHTVQVSLLR